MWDPAQYLRFGDERSRPFFDLTARIGAEAPEYVVDLGCGPGHLTGALAERWPGARVAGVDSSPEMIKTAQTHYSERIVPSLSFTLADLREWTPDRAPDVIVSNAVLQWVPDHDPHVELLAGGGFQIDAWETTYQHVLRGENPVLEWTRGSTLRPVLALLDPEQAADFTDEYGQRVREAYRRYPFGVIFPFRRIFVVVRKA
jgi:trans-aconitate 2-methyltransferase